MDGLIRMHGPKGIEIAVSLLCRCNAFNQALSLCQHLRIGIGLQRVGNTFQSLEDIRIIEGIGCDRLVLKGGLPCCATLDHFSGQVKVLHAT